MKFFKWAIVTLAVAGFFAACSSKDDDSNKIQKQTIDGQSILKNENLTPEQKSEELTNAGEHLFTPEAYFLAYKLFQSALIENPKNKRAEFYLAFIKPLMNLKGIVTRIQPLLDKDPVTKEEFMSNYNDSIGGRFRLDEFLRDNSDSLIENEEDVLAFIDKQTLAYNEMRKFFKDNRDLELEVNLAEMWYDKRREVYGDVCTYTEIYDMSYDVECKTNIDFMKMKVDRGEMEVFKNVASGLQVASILMTTYNANGLMEYISNERELEERNDKNRVELAVATDDKLGTLRSNGAALKNILALGIDGMSGVRWVQQQQEKLCPPPSLGTSFVYDKSKDTYSYWIDNNGGWHSNMIQGKKQLRRQGYVFDSGLCLDNNTFGQDLNALLNSIDVALKGGVIKISGNEKEVKAYTYDKYKIGEDGLYLQDGDGNLIKDGQHTFYYLAGTGNVIEANFQPANFINKPLKDLRSILPNDYSDCGEMKSFLDNSLGGIFPDKDAHIFLEKTAEINRHRDQCQGKK